MAAAALAASVAMREQSWARGREEEIALGPSGGANRQWRGLCDGDLTEGEGRRGMGGARAAVGDLAEGEGRHAR